MKIKIYSLILIMLFVSGCSEQKRYGSIEFMEMGVNSLELSEHINLCAHNPNSIFCTTTDSIGDTYPTKEYALSILKEMNLNFKYKNDSTWHYNSSIYEYLIGDCEDIASTMAKHMIDDGIDTKYLHLAFRKISKDEYHIFLAVDTSDAGMLHLDYANSGYQIEPRINFHMRMDNVGVDKWVKGNIK